MEQHFILIQMLTDRKITPTPQPSTSISTTALSTNSTTKSITEFHYDRDANVTFDMWFRLDKDLFKFDFTSEPTRPLIY